MGLPEIAPRALHAWMQSAPVFVVDVNAEERWRTARVPGAVHLDPQAFGAADLPLDLDAALVFYCSNPLCRKAPNAARRARGLGYRQVRVMAAGITGWIDAALPTESGTPRDAAARTE
jgi:rhodanese-related sulfurtransferase